MQKSDIPTFIHTQLCNIRRFSFRNAKSHQTKNKSHNSAKACKALFFIWSGGILEMAVYPLSRVVFISFNVCRFLLESTLKCFLSWG